MASTEKHDNFASVWEHVDLGLNCFWCIICFITSTLCTLLNATLLLRQKCLYLSIKTVTHYDYNLVSLPLPALIYPLWQCECAITVKSCTALPGSNVAWLHCVLVGCCEAAGVREGSSFWVWSVHPGLYKNSGTTVAPVAWALSAGWEWTQWHSRLRVGAGLRRQLRGRTHRLSGTWKGHESLRDWTRRGKGMNAYLKRTQPAFRRASLLAVHLMDKSHCVCVQRPDFSSKCSIRLPCRQLP